MKYLVYSTILTGWFLSCGFSAHARVYIHYGKQGVIVMTNDPYYGIDYLKDCFLVKTDPSSDQGPRAWLRIPGREVAVEKGVGDEIKGFKIVKIDDRSVVVDGGGIRYRFEIKEKTDNRLQEFEEQLDLLLTDLAIPKQNAPDLSDFMVEQTLFVNEEADSVKIRRKDSDISIKAELNDTIDGYRLKKIEKEKLVFEKDGQEFVVPVSQKKVSVVSKPKDPSAGRSWSDLGGRGPVVRYVWYITGGAALGLLVIAYAIGRRYGVTWKRKPRRADKEKSPSPKRQLGFQADSSIVYDGPVRISEMPPSDFVELVVHLIQRSGFLVKKKHEIGIGLAEVVAFSNHPISGGKYIIRCQASTWAPKVAVESIDILRERMADEHAVKGIYISTAPFSKEAGVVSRENNIKLLGLKDISQLAERYYLGEYVA